MEARFGGVEQQLGHHNREIQRVDKKLDETKKRLADRIDRILEERLGEMQSSSFQPESRRPEGKKEREGGNYYR